ncbi:hypothetical protein RBI22_05370 [Alcaligenaceae bacterium C4P045]|nr:hypothetical protein [Alcaligenaceae bacterium C4P045]
MLDSEAQNEIHNLLAWRSHLRGGATPQIADLLNRSPAHPPLVDVKYSKWDVRIAAQTIPCHSVSALFDGATLGIENRSVEVSLGSEILMESCAVEAECMLFERNGASANDLLRAIPVYPYRTARAIFEGIVGVVPSHRFICSICLLALQSTDPGDAFISIAKSCLSAGKEFDDAAELKRLKINSDDYIRDTVKKILAETLPSEIGPFAARGHAGRGLARMLAWCNTLFEERLKDSWFEITALDGTQSLATLVELLRTMPVCPIIHEINALEKREELLFFSEAEILQDHMNEIGAAQSLLHLSATHLAMSGNIVPTSSTCPRACFFVNVCQAPLALERSSVCQKAPWESFDHTAAYVCWYAAGVSAARARPNAE